MPEGKAKQVAVVGAGIAGATVAHQLTLAGHAVQVFDKSRGPGGRMATRRAEWVDPQGLARTTGLDHGAVAITARTAAFRAFAEQARTAACLAEWAPVLSAASLPCEAQRSCWVPTPDSPAWCRHLLNGTAATWSFAVDGLHLGPSGWQVAAGGARHSTLFDAVVLALPPAQAAPLLAPHRRDWARQASVIPMQPCWTLMGVAASPNPSLGWDLARPPEGPLAWLLRSDARPGRVPVPGQAHWVAHARAGWSRRHLEQPAAWVQHQLQAALADFLGQSVEWQHCEVHRWRYALPRAQRVDPAQSCWWDAALGLGVCGDFLGGCGIEGAWLSGQALSSALLQRKAEAAEPLTWRADQPAVPAHRMGAGCEGPR